jgi:flagellar M-ring protein FliF
LNAIRNIVSQLGMRRLLIMGGVALALLGGLSVLALRGETPRMGYLYTDLDPSAASSIAAKLKAQNVAFTLSPDGTSIMAPDDKLAELRMSLAGEQLGGKIGYDVLDQEEPFGVSSSRAKMNETRAIEGELAKSIDSLQTISGARVHIVMPERAMFSNESRKATAAVTVKTNGRLPRETVASIRYLVASSVPELSPDAISIVDQTGALLARAGDGDVGGGGDLDEQQAGTEARLRAQIEQLVSPIVGEGKVRAEVSALLERDQTREETEVFDPDKQVIAHQITVEAGDQSKESDGGPQGASVGAQLPDAQATAAGNQNNRQAARNENSEDTTYENSKTRTVTVRNPGKVKRLTVAVMVDGGAKGLPAAQVQRLQRLVENAVGFDAERGDSVVVENMPFQASEVAADEAKGLPFGLTWDSMFGVIKFLILGVVGLLALRMLRPRGARGGVVEQIAGLPAPEPTELQALTARAAEGDEQAIRQLELMRESGSDLSLLDQEIALAQVDGRIKLSVLKRIGDAVTGSPAESAAVVRQWMNA